MQRRQGNSEERRKNGCWGHKAERAKGVAQLHHPTEFVNEYILCLAMGLSQAENPKAITKVSNSCKAGEFQSEFKTL